MTQTGLINTVSQLSPHARSTHADDAGLRSVAQELEASFLAEMFKHAGFGSARSSMGGGVGEEQFASLMRMEHARAVAQNGGIGLAESLFQSLLARSERGGDPSR